MLLSPGSRRHPLQRYGHSCIDLCLHAPALHSDTLASRFAGVTWPRHLWRPRQRVTSMLNSAAP